MIYILLKVIKKQGFTLSLEHSFLEQSQGIQCGSLSPALTFLRLTIITVLLHNYINGKACEMIKNVVLYIIPLTLHFYCSILF